MAKAKNPIAPFQPKRYICARWPFLRLGGGVQFKAGHLTAASKDVVARVENSDGFKSGAIVEIKERQRPEPTVEQAAEEAALAELEVKMAAPRVRRGAIGTREIVG